MLCTFEKVILFCNINNSKLCNINDCSNKTFIVCYTCEMCTARLEYCMLILLCCNIAITDTILPLDIQ